MTTTVTEASIDAMLENAPREGWVVWGKEMNISYVLENGFTVTGRCACVNPENFDLDIGKRLCYDDAKRQLWSLEGYRLQWKLYEDGTLPRYGGYEPV